MTQKLTDRVKPTYILDTAEGGAYQDTERNRPSKAHSPAADSGGRDLSEHERNQESEAHLHPGDNRGRDLSGHGIRPSEAHLLPEDGRGRDLSGYGKELTGRGPLTSCTRPQREGLVRTQKEESRLSHGHGHSHTGKRNEKVKSVDRNNVRESNHRSQRMECGLATVLRSGIIFKMQYN